MRSVGALALALAIWGCAPAGDGSDHDATPAPPPAVADPPTIPNASADATPPPIGPPGARLEAWSCDGGTFGAAAGETEAILHLPDRTLRLPRVLAASGARYASDDARFWSRGDEATLEVDGRSWHGCRLDAAAGVWLGARLRGVRFRAIGQEPGWHIEVFPRETKVVADYGEIELALPPPELDRGEDGRVRGLAWPTDAHAVAVRIERTTCADPMSGFESPLTVRMTLDGRELRGCGRELGPAFLGDWRIVRLGPASPPPAGGEGAATLAFGAWGDATASTGCNRARGEWTSPTAGALRIGPLATTRRACARPAMAQEARVLESLAAVRGYAIGADSLHLLGPDGDRLLTAVRSPG